MKKYIDREALIDWLKRIPLKDLSDGLGLCRVIMEDDFKKAIKEMPEGIIVDVAPVRNGTWLSQCDRTHFCSECGKDALYEQFDTFCFREKLSELCPNCGARMDGGAVLRAK